MQISDKNYSEADYSLFQISLAADNIECIALAMDERNKGESFEANAMHFTANYLRTEIENVRNLLFGPGARGKEFV